MTDEFKSRGRLTAKCWNEVNLAEGEGNSFRQKGGVKAERHLYVSVIFKETAKEKKSILRYTDRRIIHHLCSYLSTAYIMFLYISVRFKILYEPVSSIEYCHKLQQHMGLICIVLQRCSQQWII